MYQQKVCDIQRVPTKQLCAPSTCTYISLFSAYCSTLQHVFAKLASKQPRRLLCICRDRLSPPDSLFKELPKQQPQDKEAGVFPTWFYFSIYVFIQYVSAYMLGATGTLHAVKFETCTKSFLFLPFWVLALMASASTSKIDNILKHVDLGSDHYALLFGSFRLQNWKQNLLTFTIPVGIQKIEIYFQAYHHKNNL